MSNRTLVIVSTVFLLLIAFCLGGYFIWQHIENHIANDPMTHFGLAEKAIGNSNSVDLQNIITQYPHVVHDRSTFDGGTLLHQTMITIPNQACAIVLISAGADVNAKDGMGQTPLHYVCKYSEDLSAIKFLVANGADANIQDRGGNKPVDLMPGPDYDGARAYLLDLDVPKHKP